MVTAQRKRWPKRNTEKNALLTDAQTLPRKEECALGMGQRSNDAAAWGAQIKLRKEEYALDTGQPSKSSDAAAKVVQTKSSKEECVLDMEQR